MQPRLAFCRWPSVGARACRWAALVVAVLVMPMAACAFDSQGHRGARGLAPENTLVGFERALSVGVHTLELDVLLTADQVVVIGHDPRLQPAIVRDASGRWINPPGPTVRSLSHAQLQAYDVGRIDPSSAYARTFALQQPHDGARMPTLAALFEQVRQLGALDVHFNIETKLSPLKPDETAEPDAMVRALLAVIDQADVRARVTIQSFDWRTLQIVQRLAPGVPTGYLSIQTPSMDNLRDGTWTAGLQLSDHGGSVPRLVKAAGGRVWSPHAGGLSAALVQEAQALGLRVVPWTVNSPQDMARLMDWGVDGLITDYPDRLRTVMHQRGLPLPAPLRRPPSTRPPTP